MPVSDTRGRRPVPSSLCTSLPLQLSSFLNIIHIRLKVYWSNAFAQDTGFEFQSSGQFPFDSNFKRTITCLVSRANVNELSAQRTNWRYHCSMTYVTQKRTSSREEFSFIVTSLTSHSKGSASQNEFFQSIWIAWLSRVTLLTWRCRKRSPRLSILLFSNWTFY